MTQSCLSQRESITTPTGKTVKKRFLPRGINVAGSKFSADELKLERLSPKEDEVTLEVPPWASRREKRGAKFIRDDLKTFQEDVIVARDAKLTEFWVLHLFFDPATNAIVCRKHLFQKQKAYKRKMLDLLYQFPGESKDDGSRSPKRQKTLATPRPCGGSPVSTRQEQTEGFSSEQRTTEKNRSNSLPSPAFPEDLPIEQEEPVLPNVVEEEEGGETVIGQDEEEVGMEIVSVENEATSGACDQEGVPGEEEHEMDTGNAEHSVDVGNVQGSAVVAAGNDEEENVSMEDLFGSCSPSAGEDFVSTNPSPSPPSALCEVARSPDKRPSRLRRVEETVSPSPSPEQSPAPIPEPRRKQSPQPSSSAGFTGMEIFPRIDDIQPDETVHQELQIQDLDSVSDDQRVILASSSLGTVWSLEEDTQRYAKWVDKHPKVEIGCPGFGEWYCGKDFVMFPWQLSVIACKMYIMTGHDLVDYSRLAMVLLRYVEKYHVEGQSKQNGVFRPLYNLLNPHGSLSRSTITNMYNGDKSAQTSVQKLSALIVKAQLIPIKLHIKILRLCTQLSGEDFKEWWVGARNVTYKGLMKGKYQRYSPVKRLIQDGKVTAGDLGCFLDRF